MKQIISIIGLVVLFIGIFSPVVSVPMIGNINYFHQQQTSATILLIMIAFSLIFILHRMFVRLFIASMLSLVIVLVGFFELYFKISDVKQEMSRDLAGNPFRGFVDLAMSTIQIQWGWVLLILGAILVMISSVMKDEQYAIQNNQENVASNRSNIKILGSVLAMLILGFAIAHLWFLNNPNNTRYQSQSEYKDKIAQNKITPKSDEEILTKKAHQGNIEAQYKLATMYEEGNGVPINEVEAVKWYRKAAEAGVAEAQFNLGVRYTIGKDVPQAHEQAVEWLKKAAVQGLAKAQFNLGQMYKLGKGVQADNLIAAYWFRKAAEQGFAEAQFNLGNAYLKGEGLKADPIEAVNWYAKSAEQGLAEAQYNLGIMYDEGAGISKNSVKAYIWLSLSANQGFDKASIERENVGKKLNQSQLEAAQKLTSQWQAKIQKNTHDNLLPVPGTQAQNGTMLKDSIENFKILNARIYYEQSGYSKDLYIELTVKNDTPYPISRAYFNAIVISPGRTVPWANVNFNYQIPGGIEPGEKLTWKLNPNIYVSEWGNIPDRPDLELKVQTNKLEGPNGETLFE